LEKAVKIESHPYYSYTCAYTPDNKEKAILGEAAFCEALSDFPVMVNVTYGKRQKDIDHLVFTGSTVVMNECKNTHESFFMHYSWFCSHVADRFADGLPVAQYYAQTMGYKIKSIKFTLTIPKLNCTPIVKQAIKGLKVSVIETGVQLLKPEDKQSWTEPIRKHILSVINTIQDNTSVSTMSILTNAASDSISPPRVHLFVRHENGSLEND
jgi:hypothetical protein